MSGEWPDELRSVVRALIDGGASPSVVPASGGGWCVYLAGERVEYTTMGHWWRGGRSWSAEAVVTDLLHADGRSSAPSEIDPRYALSDRIREAVPGALVAIWSDGIEVTVGPKSVRWKREKRGWSMDDDLYTTDERVIEHAKAMAAEAVPRPLLERLREAVPGLRWESDGEAVVGRRLGRPQNVDAAIRDGKLLCWLNSPREPHAVQIECPGDDECVRIVTEWYAKTHAAPAAPAAPTLLERLRTAIPSLTWRQEGDECIGCDARGDWRAVVVGKAQAHLVTCNTGARRTARAVNGFDAVVQHIGRYLHGDSESAAPQPSPRTLDTTAAMHAAADFGRGSDSTAVTVAINGNILDTEALTRAIEEQTKREQAHAAKGTTMTTQTKTQALIQTAKLDASEAAWRTAGSQFVKLAREPLVGLLTRHLAPNDDAFRARLAAFLETELGTALLASMLSATLSALPQTTGEVPQKLARELRVKAMADAGDVMADVLAGPLRRVMADYLHGVSVTSSPALGDGAETVADDLLRAATSDRVPR